MASRSAARTGEVQPYALVVDDEEPIAQLIAMTLRDDGFHVRTAADGHTALALLEASPPDLVVLDVMLPDIDGFAIQARVAEWGRPLPVLFLTARDSTEDKVRGLTLGGDDYLVKPFSLEELVARIEAVLRRKLDGNGGEAPPLIDTIRGVGYTLGEPS